MMHSYAIQLVHHVKCDGFGKKSLIILLFGKVFRRKTREVLWSVRPMVCRRCLHYRNKVQSLRATMVPDSMNTRRKNLMCEIEEVAENERKGEKEREWQPRRDFGVVSTRMLTFLYKCFSFVSQTNTWQIQIVCSCLSRFTYHWFHSDLCLTKNVRTKSETMELMKYTRWR